MLRLDLRRDVIQKTHRRFFIIGALVLLGLVYVGRDPNSIFALAVLAIPIGGLYSAYSDNSFLADVVSPELVIYLFVTGFTSVAILALCTQYTVLAILSNLFWGVSASDFLDLSEELGTVRAVLQLTGKQSIVIAILFVCFMAFGVAAISEEVSKYMGYSWTSLVDTVTKSKHTIEREEPKPHSHEHQQRDHEREHEHQHHDQEPEEPTSPTTSVIEEKMTRSRSNSSTSISEGSVGDGDGDGKTMRLNQKSSKRRFIRRQLKAGRSPYHVVITMVVIGLGFATMEG